jgi:NADH-quinone oxidoreductase subunit G
LKNAIDLVEKIRCGECKYDLIEVMACPGGCICGAGQPISRDDDIRRLRAKGLYSADKMMQLHKSQDNYLVAACYDKYLDKPGSHTAHKLLHTEYQNRRRICGEQLVVLDNDNANKLSVTVCVGTSCFVRGSQTLMRSLIDYVEGEGLAGIVGIEATFCFENCDSGPTVQVGGSVLHRCTLEMAKTAIQNELAAVK